MGSSRYHLSLGLALKNVFKLLDFICLDSDEIKHITSLFSVMSIDLLDLLLAYCSALFMLLVLFIEVYP